MPGKRARHRRTRGVVLFEVMVSLVVFSAGIIAVMRAVSVCLQTRGDIQGYTTAMFLAQQVMSEAEGAVNITELPVGGTFPEPYSQFKWSRSISESGLQVLSMAGQDLFMPEPDDDFDATMMPENGKMPVLYKATVTIHWTRRGQDEQLTTATLIPPREPRERQTQKEPQDEKRNRRRR